MVLQALEETGVAAEDTAIIDDSSYDMAMAKAAGALALGVSWGYHLPHTLLEAGAAAVFDAFAALMPALEGVWPELSVSRLWA
jgi:phosphoglycolate phosphatase